MNTAISGAGALVATGVGYDPTRHAADIERLAKVMPLARDVRRGGSAALDLAFVAAGRLDGFFERGLHPWDMAAGSLLVTEAGGQVGGIGGAAAGADMVIAAGPELYERLVEVIDS